MLRYLQGSRFAILHGDGPKPQLSVYDMKDVRNAVKVCHFDPLPCRSI